MCVLMCCSESTYRALPCTRPERRSQAPAAARLSAPAVCRAAGRPAAGRCSPCVCGATDRPAADTPAHRAAALGPADAARHTSESSSAHKPHRASGRALPACAALSSSRGFLGDELSPAAAAGHEPPPAADPPNAAPPALRPAERSETQLT